MLRMDFSLELAYFTLQVDLAVKNGVLVLSGPSGCGKTTVLKCIAGLERPDDGSIVLNERTLFSSKGSVDIKPRFRSVGLVFQDYALFPHLTVDENITYGLLTSHRTQAERAVENGEALGEILEMFKIEHLRRRYPKQLSGGEKQRVALARTLILRPELLLLDEPLSALDAETREVLQSELKELQRLWNIPFILVTHDHNEAKRLGDAYAQVGITEKRDGSGLPLGRAGMPGAEERALHIFNNGRTRQ